MDRRSSGIRTSSQKVQLIKCGVCYNLRFAQSFLLWCNHIKSDAGLHLLQIHKHGSCTFVLLSSALLRNLKNNNPFKRAWFYYINTHTKVYFTSQSVEFFCAKVNRPFFHKISCGVSWVGGVVLL